MGPTKEQLERMERARTLHRLGSATTRVAGPRDRVRTSRLAERDERSLQYKPLGCQHGSGMCRQLCREGPFQCSQLSLCLLWARRMRWRAPARQTFTPSR